MTEASKSIPKKNQQHLLKSKGQYMSVFVSACTVYAPYVHCWSVFCEHCSMKFKVKDFN